MHFLEYAYIREETNTLDRDLIPRIIIEINHFVVCQKPSFSDANRT